MIYQVDNGVYFSKNCGMNHSTATFYGSHLLPKTAGPISILKNPPLLYGVN